MTIKYDCYDNWNLFRGGLTICQAQHENSQVAPYNAKLSGYWYQNSMTMSVRTCANSCLKYGYVYAAINP